MKKLHRVILGFHEYTLAWDACESTRIPIFSIDRHIFQLKLASGQNIYCLAVDQFVSKRFAKIGFGGLPTSWIAKADLIYNQTTRNRAKFKTTNFKRERSDAVFAALQKRLAKKDYTVYEGPTIARVRHGKRRRYVPTALVS